MQQYTGNYPKGYQEALLRLVDNPHCLNIGGTELPVGYKSYVSAVNTESDTIPYNALRFDIEVALNDQGRYWKFIKETEYKWQSNGDWKYITSNKLV